MKGTLVYVGTFTGAGSRGIYLFRLRTSEDPEVPPCATLLSLGLAAETLNPSFLEIDPRRRLLFCVNELDVFEGSPSGAVSAFAIDADTGRLILLNQRSSGGPGPCHLAIDKASRNVLVANYTGGSVTVLPIGPDGRLGEATDHVQHRGRSVDPDRQTSAHAHCVTLDPANRFAFVCDLGIDRVVAYRFDAIRGKLSAHEPGSLAVKPGAGPRHMVFGPDGRFAYLINEIDSTLSVFAYSSDAGVLEQLQTLSTLPSAFNGPSTAAEIGVHPSGKYLYASNRGRNSIVLFTIDPDRGTLTLVEDSSAAGKIPRHFEIDANGEHLVIANQDSNNLLVAGIDPVNGRLGPAGLPVPAPAPVCVKFFDALRR